MDKIPFTSYDFWGYLAAGFLLLYAVDQVCGTGVFARESWTVVEGIVAVSGAYVVGQLVASVSAAVLERFLVGKVLGYPQFVLFENPPETPSKTPAENSARVPPPVRRLRRMLPDYYKPLPIKTQQAVLKRGNVEAPEEALFMEAASNAREMEVVKGRLDTFLNLYGFSRNIALVAFIDAAILLGAYWCIANAPKSHLYWAVGLLVIGGGMFLRYLKFYRLYAVEVFAAFAYGKSAHVNDE